MLLATDPVFRQVSLQHKRIDRRCASRGGKLFPLGVSGWYPNITPLFRLGCVAEFCRFCKLPIQSTTKKPQHLQYYVVGVPEREHVICRLIWVT